MRIYTDEQLDWLRQQLLVPLDEITTGFNAHSGTSRSPASIQSAYKNHGICRGRKAPGKGNGTPSVYTPERVAWLRENYPLMPVAELTVAYNAAFGCSHTVNQIKSACGRYGARAGRTSRFEKGIRPWNTGTKGTGVCKPNCGNFKPGNLPHNHRPLWSERVCSKDNYIYISVPETNPYTGFPTRFKQKHVWIWEQVNGPVPKKHAIIFVDGDLRNFDIDNLLCIHRKVLLLLNLHDYKHAPAEVKPSILALARLEAEAGIRTVRAAKAGRKRKD